MKNLKKENLFHKNMKRAVNKKSFRKVKREFKAMWFKGMRQKTFQRTLERQFYHLQRQTQSFPKNCLKSIMWINRN